MAFLVTWVLKSSTRMEMEFSMDSPYNITDQDWAPDTYDIAYAPRLSQWVRAKYLSNWKAETIGMPAEQP